MKCAGERYRNTNSRCTERNEVTAPSNSCSQWDTVPQSDGDLTPAGGGTVRPTRANTWPMKPSGDQLARPIFPPGLPSRAGVVRREHHAEGGDGGVELAVDEGQRLGITLDQRHVQPLRPGALVGACQERGDVVEAGHLAEPARRSQGGG